MKEPTKTELAIAHRLMKAYKALEEAEKNKDPDIDKVRKRVRTLEIRFKEESNTGPSAHLASRLLRRMEDSNLILLSLLKKHSYHGSEQYRQERKRRRLIQEFLLKFYE